MADWGGRCARARLGLVVKRSVKKKGLRKNALNDNSEAIVKAGRTRWSIGSGSAWLSCILNWVEPVALEHKKVGNIGSRRSR